MNVRRLLAKHRRRLRADTRGATAVEYGLIVSLVVITLVVAIMSVADATSNVWNNVHDKVAAAR